MLPTDDQLVSTVNWLYSTYMRLNMTAEADTALSLVKGKELRVIVCPRPQLSLSNQTPLRVIYGHMLMACLWLQEETLYANLTAMYIDHSLLPGMVEHLTSIEKTAPGNNIAKFPPAENVDRMCS